MLVLLVLYSTRLWLLTQLFIYVFMRPNKLRELVEQTCLVVEQELRCAFVGVLEGFPKEASNFFFF